MIAVAFVIFLVVALILAGFPVFIALGLSGLIGFLITGGLSSLAALPSAMYGQIDSFVLVAVPLYIFMGEILAASGLGKDLFATLSNWFNRIPGGLAVASTWACALFGAVCGVSIAGVAAIGPFAVPEMVKKGYDGRLASGSLAASGALATLIPPSIVMIVYGSIAHVSVAKLFIGGIVPGIVLAALMSIYVILRVLFNPKLAPMDKARISWGVRFRSLLDIAPVLALAVTIVVTLYSGAATATELGAFGVVGAMVIARFFYKNFNFPLLRRVLFSSTRATSAVLLIVASSLCFGNFLNYMKVPEIFAKWSLTLPFSPSTVVVLFMVLLVFLGMLVDGISVIVITTPILLPAVISMGLDPLWYGILVALNIEIAVISPPVGMNLYMMKGVVPELSLDDIIAGAAPFMIVEFICILLFLYFPQFALWLPNLMG